MTGPYPRTGGQAQSGPGAQVVPETIWRENARQIRKGEREMAKTRLPGRAHMSLLAGACAMAAILSGCAASESEADICDRACLIELGDSYVAALAANDPSGLPLAEGVSFFENLQPLQLGEGLWTDTSGEATDFAVRVPDETRQTFGWLGMIERQGEPALVAIRLKLEDGRIAEAEHLITAIRPENAERLMTPRPGLLSEVPEASRLPHDQLIAIGASYYDALDDNDGSLTPFAPDCERHENGMITAGSGPRVGPGPNDNTAPIARDCAGQLTSNVMAYIDTIDNRRVFAADPVTGLVMGLSHFRHSMDFEPYEVTALDGSTLNYGPDRFPFEKFDLPAAHILKVGADGMVHEIEAMGFMTDYQSPTVTGG